MPNHPNRGRRSVGANPSPAEILAARTAAGLTQKEAAALIFCSWRTWQDWELGARRMHPAFWLLWRFIRAGYALPPP